MADHEEEMKVECCQYSDQLTKNLNILRQANAFCDIKFVAKDGKSVNAHTCVVAASSPYLNNVLGQGKEISAIEISTADVLEALIDFMYTGHLKVKPDVLSEISVVAKQLEIDSLMDLCKGFGVWNAAEERHHGESVDDSNDEPVFMDYMDEADTTVIMNQLQTEASDKMNNTPATYIHQGKSPGELGKGPGELGNSPGELGKSPVELGKSPGELGKSPGELGKSPGELGTKQYVRKCTLETFKRTLPKEQSHTCDQCHKVFASKKYLLQHKKSHTVPQPVVCKTCKETFQTLKQLKKHEAHHTTAASEDSNQGDSIENSPSTSLACMEERETESPAKNESGVVYICSMCTSAVDDVDSYCDGEPLYCGNCVKIHQNEEAAFFSGATSLQTIETSLAEIDEAWIGTSADWSDSPSESPQTKSKRRRERKILDVKSTNKPEKSDSQSVVCDTCGKLCANEKYLRNHIESHHSGDGDKPHVCDICEKAFLIKSYLTKHRKIHSEVKPFVCEICQMSFHRKVSLDMHRYVHIKAEAKIPCPDCELEFATLAKFRKHQQAVHPKEKTKRSKYTVRHCTTCDKSFNQKYEYDRHMLTHSDDKPFCCKTCGKTFKRKGDLNSHEKTHLDVRPFACDFCGHRFTKMAYLQTHLPVHTGVRELKHTCPLCDKQFQYPYLLKSHVDKVHYNVKPFKCELCSSSFTVRRLLVQHMDGHLGIRRYNCQYCSKKYKTKDALNVHELLHTQGRQYPCQKCPKSFITAKQLSIHTELHSSTKHHLCQFCYKMYATESRLKEHEKFHTITKAHVCKYCTKAFFKLRDKENHERVHMGERPYVCQNCSKSFTNRSSLYKHKLTHMPGRRVQRQPGTCGICFKTFQNASYLTIHLRTHTGDKPYKCSACDKGFISSSFLAAHKQTHSKLRPFACTLCYKTFKLKGTLNAHIKAQHEMEQLVFKKEIEVVVLKEEILD